MTLVLLVRRCNSTVDENSLSISGGFGKIVLGQDDDAADSYNIDEMDLPTEEPGSTLASASIGTSSSVGSTDAMKVAYHLPAMGGLTAGVSFADSGTILVLIKHLWVQNTLWKLVVHL